jgi:hypothetical protein
VKLQLIGLPLAAHRRLKPQFEEWAAALSPNHSILAVSSVDDKRRNLPKADLPEVHERVQGGFVHLGVVPGRQVWDAVYKAFKFDCRVRLLPLSDPINSITWEELQQVLIDMIEFEQRWLDMICPTDLRNPLLLPPPSFEPDRDLNDYWSKCDVYRDAAQLGIAHELLNKVRTRHRKPREKSGQVWVDSKSRRFAFDPARHARSPLERTGRKRYRFCFNLPAGFHFDVQHESEREFILQDRMGASHRGRHLNVDPWGSVR